MKSNERGARQRAIALCMAVVLTAGLVPVSPARAEAIADDQVLVEPTQAPADAGKNGGGQPEVVPVAPDSDEVPVEQPVPQQNTTDESTPAVPDGESQDAKDTMSAQGDDSVNQTITIKKDEPLSVDLAAWEPVSLEFASTADEYCSLSADGVGDDWYVIFEVTEKRTGKEVAQSGDEPVFRAEAGKTYLIAAEAYTARENTFSNRTATIQLKSLGAYVASHELVPGADPIRNIIGMSDHDLTFTCHPTKSGRYQLSCVKPSPEGSQDEPEDLSAYALNIRREDNRKVIQSIESPTSSSVFYLEAGKGYELVLSHVYETTRCAASLKLVDESHEGSERLRITKVDGKDVDERYGLYVPAQFGTEDGSRKGSQLELEACIPLWQVVRPVDGGTTVSEIELSGSFDLEATDKSARVMLGDQELTDAVVEWTTTQWSGERVSFDLSDCAALHEADLDLNQELVITVSVPAGLANTDDCLFFEGLDGYPVANTYGVEAENIVYADGYAYQLRYESVDNEQEVCHAVVALDNALTLLVVPVDALGKPVEYEVDETTHVLTHVDYRGDETKESTAAMYLLSADGKTRIDPTSSRSYDETSNLTSGFEELLYMANYDGSGECFLSFRGVQPGSYTLAYDENNDGTVEVSRPVEVGSGASYVTDINEAGFRVVYDEAEVSFHNYGRLLSIGESGSENTSMMPSLPFGTLNGAAVTFAVPQEYSDAAMKIVKDNGELADAVAAAYGDVVTFRTSTKLHKSDASVDTGMLSFDLEYTFPDSHFHDEFSGDVETLRPFNVHKDKFEVYVQNPDGSKVPLKHLAEEDEKSVADSQPHYSMHDESSEEVDYADGGSVQQIELEGYVPADKIQDDATLIVLIPATLTGSLSCGGYGNKVMVEGEIGREDLTDINVVYSGTFILQSMTRDGAPLPGARFSLEREDGQKLNVAAVRGLSIHEVPESVIDGGDNQKNVLVGHAATEADGAQGQQVDNTYACLSYAGVSEGTYVLKETQVPDEWRTFEGPIRLELSAHVPSTIVTGGEYCRWSVMLNGKELPELLRYQTGLLNPTLPSDAFKDSFIAYSCQSSTIVLRALHIPNNITARVVWNDKGFEQDRPDHVRLQLVRNGTVLGDAVTISEHEGWTTTWERLIGAADAWGVVEAFDSDNALLPQADAPAHTARSYETIYSDVRYENDQAVITVTNTPLLNVTFDSDGGTQVDAQTVAAGKQAVRPNDPTKDGYVFDGWYAGGRAYDFQGAVNHDLTLVAHWKPQATSSQADAGASDSATTTESSSTKDATTKRGGKGKTDGTAATGTVRGATSTPRVATTTTSAVGSTVGSTVVLPKTGDVTGGAVGIVPALAAIGSGLLLRRRQRK